MDEKVLLVTETLSDNYLVMVSKLFCWVFENE